jgi:hypothetical protein
MQETIRKLPQQHTCSVPTHLRSAFESNAFPINRVEVVGESPAIGRLPALILSTNETTFEKDIFF